MRDCWTVGDSLEPLEEAMLEAAKAGEPLEPHGDSAGAVADTIRAEVLRHLLVGKDWDVAARGVWLRWVHVSGRLDLAGAQVSRTLRME